MFSYFHSKYITSIYLLQELIFHLQILKRSLASRIRLHFPFYKFLSAHPLQEFNSIFHILKHLFASRINSHLQILKRSSASRITFHLSKSRIFKRHSLQIFGDFISTKSEPKITPNSPCAFLSVFRFK